LYFAPPGIEPTPQLRGQRATHIHRPPRRPRANGLRHIIVNKDSTPQLFTDPYILVIPQTSKVIMSELIKFQLADNAKSMDDSKGNSISLQTAPPPKKVEEVDSDDELLGDDADFVFMQEYRSKRLEGKYCIYIIFLILH
jgi:hypothetical protein